MHVNKIDLSTILMAKQGDAIAMDKILKHYDSLINRLATKICEDNEGKQYRTLDISVKERIVSKLMLQIIYKYRIGGGPETATCFE